MKTPTRTLDILINEARCIHELIEVLEPLIRAYELNLPPWTKSPACEKAKAVLAKHKHLATN